MIWFRIIKKLVAVENTCIIYFKYNVCNSLTALTLTTHVQLYIYVYIYMSTIAIHRTRKLHVYLTHIFFLNKSSNTCCIWIWWNTNISTSTIHDINSCSGDIIYYQLTIDTRLFFSIQVVYEFPSFFKEWLDWASFNLFYV